MAKEKSCGAVVFTRENGEIRFLLIRNLAGTYGFPKGHVEGSETEKETALREVYEEVGLRISLLDGFRTEETYYLPGRRDTLKKVVYFLGEYHDQTFRHQETELSDAVLKDCDTAMSLFRFDNTRRVLTEARDFLLKQEK